REGLEHVFARQIEREQEHERAISRNEGTQRTDEKLYQSSHERGNGKEQQQDGKSSSRDAKIERGGIESDKQRNKHEHDEHKEKSQRNSQKSRARDEGLSL